MLTYKPDWPEAKRRLAALWNHERLDRPCISVLAPQPGADPTPVPEPADDQARWLDPAYRVALARPGDHHGVLWYHLDGGDAGRHLPRLLALPFLRVLQYTPAPSEPPNGPGHLEMYRRIQAAGRIVHIQLPVEHVEPLVRELDSALLMLDTRVASRAEGERLLEQCAKWTGSRR